MKVKIFHDVYVDDLEGAINCWLESHPQVSVTEILQSVSDGGVSGWQITISIFYIDGEDTRP